ncbi:MAG: transcription antitermination factor NusB [Leptospiraceae bacterium]|nr:transcription antitermination factor NusB [Leptospiraceae bacterium]
MSSRHKSRAICLQGLYQIELANVDLDEVLSYRWYEKSISEDEKELSTKLIKGVVENWETLDSIIKAYSKNRDFDRISIVNRCILRLSIFSLINMRELASRIVINEAIELTREFESEESVGFVNGILDSVYKDDLARISGEL